MPGNTASRPRARRTQAERTALSEDRLMSAALEILSERGYAGVSLQAIGEAAGYSRGLVSHRFGSKEGLLWAMVERTFAQWRADSLVPRVSGLGGVPALHACVDAARAAVKKDPARFRAFYAFLFESLGQLESLRPKVAAFHRRQRATIAGWIEAGMREGTIRPEVDAAREAALFLGMLRGASYQWILDPRNVDVDDLYDGIKETVARNLARS